MIDAVKTKETGMNSAYKTALSMLHDSYKQGRVLTTLPRPEMPLSRFEPLCIPAMNKADRREIIGKYLHSGKIFDIAATGAFAWAIMNVLNEYNDNEQVPLEQYFARCEEYFDSQINTGGLLPTDGGGSWLENIGREGVLIENQAYYAKILDVLFLLTDDEMYDFKKKRLIRAVRDKLDGAYVLDKEDSLEVRPNNFIAAFFAPELFKRDDWQKTFDASLKQKELWLDWGGLTTLGQSDSNYSSERDGSSWFFVNNMAAIALCRLNRQKYNEKIEKIISASANNILWQEHSGRPCEVTLTSGQQIKVQGLYGLSLATFVYLYRITGGL